MDWQTPAATVVDLEVPADPRWLQVVRVATTASARNVLADYATLDDLRLAVDELAVLLVQAAKPADRLSVRVWHDGGRVLVEGRVPGGRDGRLPSPSEVAEMLLSTVSDGYMLAHDGPDLVFRLAMVDRH